jgi:hypothetical protein
MKNFIHKYWFHVLIWSLMLLFLAFGPKLVGLLRSPEGLPVKLSVSLPEPNLKIKSNIETVKTNFSIGVESYQVNGWAFLFASTDSSRYDRFLVLKSAEQTLFFSVSNINRPDVQSAFSGSGLSVQNSGFSTLISPDALVPGTYRLGFLFQDHLDGSLEFGLSNGILQRTPNTLRLETLTPTPPSRPADSLPVEIEQELPETTGVIVNYLDGLSADVSANPTQYRLFGWTFLTGEVETSNLERIIVLQSNEGCYAYQAATLLRPDVQQAYQNLGQDVTDSGFEIHISEGNIPSGEYTIGILYRKSNGENLFFAPFKQKLIQQDGTWRLVGSQ